MKDSHHKSFDHLLYPYVFVLKEGKEIHTNFLDYSLLLLQVGQPDTLPSPTSFRSLPNATVQLLKK